jgi:ribosomal protein S18 acetylase RimI-like enzyme
MISEVVTGAEAASGWRRAAALGLTFRPIGDADLPFLAALYASTREEELSVVPWPDAAKAAFLDQQFRAQHAHYQENYPGAEWLVILHAGMAIGRLYRVCWAREHRVIDIALVPAQRRRGLGTALLRDVMDEARAAGKPLTIHVEKFNPAQLLYRRLGFATAEDKGVYDLLRWTPPPSSDAG